MDCYTSMMQWFRDRSCTHVHVWYVCIYVWWCSKGFLFLSHWQDGREKETEKGSGRRGSGVVLHLGWSVSHCGKTQYLHFVIRTTFTLSFSTTRIYAHLTGKVAASGLMTCTCSSPRDGQVSAGWVCVCVCVREMMLWRERWCRFGVVYEGCSVFWVLCSRCDGRVIIIWNLS